MEYFAFQWHITEACDQRCKHCYIYALGSHAKFREMALDDMVTVIENCKTFCEKAGRLPYLYITGGDPILHPQFWTLMKMLKLANIPFALMGNPFHLTEDVCRRLKDYGCRKYQLSLDGLRETHDGIRQKPGKRSCGRIPAVGAQSCAVSKGFTNYTPMRDRPADGF